MQLVLAAAGATQGGDHRVPEGQPRTLLQRVQADIVANRRPPGHPVPGGEDRRPLLDPSDRSIEVHACHGRHRQVEVLRDAVLHTLEAQPDLEPRDVIVMCPDIEAYAPLIHAAFGSGGSDAEGGAEGRDDRLPDLRVRLADRSLRQTNPLLGVVARLLDLAGSRMTATQVLDLASQEPVRRRFAFDDDDLARLEEWVAAAGVRWGLDAAHRAAYRLGPLAANTWRAGLDRLLLGVTMADERQRLFAGILPLDDVESDDIDLAGRLAELLDRLQAAVDAFAGTRSVGEWVRAIASAADALCASSDSDAWQPAELRRLLDELVGDATAGEMVSGVQLTLGDVIALLGDRLKGRPTRANFRTGHLTICTLVPMRSVPHRVVCLLGMDDGVFPRHPERDGDDLVLAEPRIGDRDARSEDRQLLLDALMAATDRLLVTYNGRDERTNLERPPAVPVGELLDVIDRTVSVAGGGPARAQVVVGHPLQPFDARNFVAGMLIPAVAWSFDAVNLEGARALGRPKAEPARFLDRPLPEVATDVIELDQLDRFARHPVAAFLRLRLGIWLGQRDRDVDDALPVELDALTSWGIAERLLNARLDGASLEACLLAERARGSLPPGALADPVLEELVPVVEQLAETAYDRAYPQVRRPPRPPGRWDLRRGGDCRGSRRHHPAGHVLPPHPPAPAAGLGASPRPRAARPEQPFEARTVGRAREGARRSTVTVARIPPFPGDRAARQGAACRHLAVVVDLYRRSMREPLPLYCRTSSAWAEAVRRGDDPVPRGRTPVEVRRQPTARGSRPCARPRAGRRPAP